MEELAGGGIIATIAAIIAIILKFRTKKTNNMEFHDKTKFETEIKNIYKKLEDIDHILGNMDEDIQKNHLEYDSIQQQITDIRLETQKQIANLRERLARIEGPK